MKEHWPLVDNLKRLLERMVWVGQGFYTNLKVLQELGLIFEVRKRVDGKNLLFTELTEKGDKVVKAIDKLYAAIEIEYPEENKRRSYMIKESGIFKPRI